MAVISKPSQDLQALIVAIIIQDEGELDQLSKDKQITSLLDASIVVRKEGEVWALLHCRNEKAVEDVSARIRLLRKEVPFWQMWVITEAMQDDFLKGGFSLILLPDALGSWAKGRWEDALSP